MELATNSPTADSDRQKSLRSSTLGNISWWGVDVATTAVEMKETTYSEPALGKEDNEDASLAWLASHLEELIQQYPNSWVLIEDCQVVAASKDDPTELERGAEQRGIENPLVTWVGQGPITWRTAYAGEVV